MNKFYEAWEFLENHKYFQYTNFLGEQDTCFPECLNIDVVKINPETDAIDEDNSKNTKVQFWLEAGCWDDDISRTTHDYRLDSYGDTFEDAIIHLASLIKKTIKLY